MSLEDAAQDLEQYSDHSDEEMALRSSAKAVNDSSDGKHEDRSGLHGSPPETVDLNVANGPAKKKKKKKSKSQRGVNKPTGFEDYYADAPLTPAQADEEAELYSPKLSFNARILTAIQRYEAKRKLDSQRRDVFYKWLVYGGVRVGPNMFQGSSIRDREGLDKDQIVSSLAQTNLNEDKEDLDTADAKYVVDFEGVMRGFLSHRAPLIFDLSLTSVTKLTSTLLNFLNYLLHHNVCPEYVDSMNAARRIINVAATDLPLLNPTQSWLPGDFNTACAVLSGLRPARPEEMWDKREMEQENSRDHKSMTFSLASQIVRVGIAAVGSDELFDRWASVMDEQPSPTPSAAILPVSVTTNLFGLEILSVHPPSPDTRTFYRENTPDFRALGRLIAKPWFDHPARPVRDLTPAEEAEEAREEERRVKEERWELFVEEQALQWLKVGMKVLGRVARWCPRDPGVGGEGKSSGVELAFWADVVGVWPSWEGGAPVNDLVLEGHEAGWRDGRSSTPGTTSSGGGDVDGYEEGVDEDGKGESGGDGGGEGERGEADEEQVKKERIGQSKSASGN